MRGSTCLPGQCGSSVLVQKASCSCSGVSTQIRSCNNIKEGEIYMVHYNMGLIDFTLRIGEDLVLDSKVNRLGQLISWEAVRL